MSQWIIFFESCICWSGPMFENCICIQAYLKLLAALNVASSSLPLLPVLELSYIIDNSIRMSVVHAGRWAYFIPGQLSNLQTDLCLTYFRFMGTAPTVYLQLERSQIFWWEGKGCAERYIQTFKLSLDQEPGECWTVICKLVCAYNLVWNELQIEN